MQPPTQCVQLNVFQLIQLLIPFYDINCSNENNKDYFIYQIIRD